MGCYTPESCPDYLTLRGFETLNANDGELLNSISLHTDTIVEWVPFALILRPLGGV